MSLSNDVNKFISGSIGGLTGTLLSHPFDTIKTRIQSGQCKTIKEALKMKRLYSGLSTPLMGIPLEKTIVFGTYQKLRDNGYNVAFSGSVAGFISTTIVTPVDNFKIQYQLGNKPNFKNIFNGYFPTLFRETLGFSIYFSTYNYLTDLYNPDKNHFKTFLFGGFSGFSAWAFIYPADIIKTKYQSGQNNLINIIKETHKIGFYKGFSLAVMRAIPLHSGVFLGWEIANKYL
jgi:solute carrier family 25 carnitine/acylcarnitine transporter 20/29